jgi:hypothetical protein
LKPRALLVLGLVFGLVGTAAAQQQGQPQPQPQQQKPQEVAPGQVQATANQRALANARAKHYPRLKFPVRASQYHQLVERTLRMMRSVAGIGPITQGDVDKVILGYRECVAGIEADGVVTDKESNYCNRVAKSLIRQQVRIYMQASPEQQAQWARQAMANAHQQPEPSH